MTTEKRAYTDKWGDEIDLSVIYGVYKTQQGLTGFFQRCTNYSQTEIEHAVKYIMSNVEPKIYSRSERIKMMKQIEGTVFDIQEDEKNHKNVKTIRTFLGIVLFILIMSVAYLSMLSSSGNSSLQEESITLDEFYQIETGMTYSEVVEIIGCDGELMSESSLIDSTYQIYTWKGSGSIGANANVSFANGAVTSKAQSGLK